MKGEQSKIDFLACYMYRSDGDLILRSRVETLLGSKVSLCSW